MKAAIFLVISLLTWFLAGMYRSSQLLILAGTEMILAASLFALSRVLIRCMDVRFSADKQWAVAGEKAVCGINLFYGGRFPAARYQIRVIWGNVEGEVEDSKILQGICIEQETALAFSVPASHCGIFSVQIQEFRVYDCLALFSCGKVLDEEMELVIYPRYQPLSITIADSEGGLYLLEHREDERALTGRNEVFQNREYRPGDGVRSIHWKLSARMGDLWVREYREEDCWEIPVILDMKGIDEASEGTRDAFYQLVCSLLAGLLDFGAVVSVTCKWNTVRERVSVRRAEQIREVLYQLYWNEKTGSEGKETLDLDQESWDEEDSYSFCVNLDLCWFCGSNFVFQFSENNLEQEIEEQVFVL